METRTESVDVIQPDRIVNITRMALFAALMGAFAFVSFPYPLSPAPVTLQVLGVFLAGILLGPVWGAGAMVLYLLAGAVGVPVFAGRTAGFGALLGPTGGYLLSYPFAAFVIGVLVHRGLEVREYRRANLPVLVGAMIAGTVVIYAGGIAGMMIVLGLGPAEAFVTGGIVFIPAEAVKILAAIGIIRSDDLAIPA
ncbi:biotin transporter BioY [Halobacteria archaeon AArc-dxtr1]|nr:biotin transporter BioY [Halobacteria archaeon AArc-dxtr1]